MIDSEMVPVSSVTLGITFIIIIIIIIIIIVFCADLMIVICSVKPAR